MRILIDLQGAQNSSRLRGIGRYSLAISKAILKNKNNHEVFILLNTQFADTIDEIKTAFSGLLENTHFVLFTPLVPVIDAEIQNNWRARTSELLLEKMVRDINPDIYLVTSLIEGAIDNTVSSLGKLVSNIKTAVILYDLIPYLAPEKYIGWEPLRIWYYRKIDSMQRADLLLSISESARKEGLDHIRHDSDSIVNISSAVDKDFFYERKFSEAEKKKFLSQYGIKKKYLMHTSAFDERKNFEGLINAYSLLPENVRASYQLVLVCKLNDANRNSLEDQVERLGLSLVDVVLTGFVPDEDLVGLYSLCHLFVFPSLHEGFGLPVLEAMHCGAPVIGSNTTSIPEVIGRADALFDPTSAVDIATAINTILSNEKKWQDLKSYSKTQIKKFDWDLSAQKAISAFEQIVVNKNDVVSEYLRQSEDNLFEEFLECYSKIAKHDDFCDEDLISLTKILIQNENSAKILSSNAAFSGKLNWRVEGPFDSSYSLALVNREFARALEALGHNCILHSTEGPGDFDANPAFLLKHEDLGEMHSKVKDYPHEAVDVVSRNLYPPRVSDMAARMNVMHGYAWEESGFPSEWINDFNNHLNGVLCTSEHVENIFRSNGLTANAIAVGNGVDHWERIVPNKNYRLNSARKFRFLHVSSCFPRKGVEAMLDAYELVFTINDDVSLIIKTFENPHNEVHQWLADRKKKNSQYPHVLILEEDLTDESLKALYQECHVLVAPSKAEGFGLPMAEAMLSGLPVVTTNWGGQLDFCNDANAWLVDYDLEKSQTHFDLFSSCWANVKVADLANKMREAYMSSNNERKEMAMYGRNLLLENYKWINVAARSVDAIHKWNQENEPQLNIGWVTTWNTQCGIATYSEHLLDDFSHEEVVVLAPYLENNVPVHEELDTCIRCWRQGKEDNDFYKISEVIEEKKLNSLIIQFNYGFFNFRELGVFIDHQLSRGRVITVVMHSTLDPYDDKNWMLETCIESLKRCHRILVHSPHDLNNLKRYGAIDNVQLFPHGVKIFEDHQIEKSAAGAVPMIATYGFALPHKGLPEILDAIAILKKRGQIVRLRMVNAEYPDPISQELIEQIQIKITQLGITDLVEIHTDFLEDDRSHRLLSEADLIVYPYQNTKESASGAVRFGLGSGRPVCVTPLKIFSDLGGSVFKFDGMTCEQLANGISEVLGDIFAKNNSAKTVEKNANLWLAQHDYSLLRKKLFNVCATLLGRNAPRKIVISSVAPYMISDAGSVSGRSLLSTGKPGRLLHGSNISLAEGNYTVRVYGLLGSKSSKNPIIEMSLSEADTILFSGSIKNLVNPRGVLACFDICLNENRKDLCLSISVLDSVQISIELIEFTRIGFDGHRENESLSDDWIVEAS